jgi:hypothetical protein
MLTRLLSLTLLVASLVGGLLALSAGREYQRLLAEHRRLERKVGNVPISDASQVHVRALKTGEPLHFAWRVYLPAGFHARWDSGRGYSTSSSSSASEFIASAFSGRRQRYSECVRKT